MGVGNDPTPIFYMIRLEICKFYHLVDSGADAIGILTTGRSEMRLTAAAALDELGSLAHQLTGVQAVVFHEVLRDADVEHGLSFVNAADDAERMLRLGGTNLEHKVLGNVGPDGKYG